jgi:type IV pilus assembly protein PilN
MIRINLLPEEDRAKKKELHLPEMSTVYLIAAVVIFIAAIMVTGSIQRHKVRDLETRIEVAKEESRKLAPQLAKIKQITREREEVNRRLSLITSLDRHRYYRVKLLNDISFKLPANCWLTDISEQSPNNFTINGITFSNFTVADMMTNLERSSLVTGVDLKVAERGQINKREVMKFSLSANVMPQ